MQDYSISEYFYGDESSQFVFFRIPRELITGASFKCVSTDAKLLYGMLLDRMGLSSKNGWYDDDGRVYIYYTIEEICEDMNCGRDKAMKLLAELDRGKGVCLIERVRQGLGKPSKIYVKRFTTRAVLARQQPDSQSRPPEVDFSDVQRSEIPTSRSRDIRRPKVEFSDPSNNNINQTDSSHTDPSIYPPTPRRREGMDRYERREEIKANIDFEHLQSTCPYDDIESLLELMVDVECSTAATMRIGGEVLSNETVKQRFRQLDSSHIEYIVDSLKQTTSKINNIRAYLFTALYNAPVTIGPYYSAAVKHNYG